MRPKATARPASFSLFRQLICASLIVVMGLLTIVAYWRTQQIAAQQTGDAFVEVTDSFVHHFTQHMENAGSLLYATRGLFATSGINANNWEQFIKAQYAFERYPGMESMVYAEIIAPEQKDAYRERVASELSNVNFAIHPASAKEQVVVTYLHEDNFKGAKYDDLLGFNLTSKPLYGAALARARSANRLTATAPLQLFSSEESGFWLILPLTTTTGTQGYSMAAFNTAALIDKTLSQYLRQYNASISIDDVADGPALSLYQKISGAEGPFMTRKITLEVGGRQWQMTFQAPEHMLQAASDRWISIFVLGTGAIMTLGIAGACYSSSMRRKLQT